MELVYLAVAAAFGYLAALVYKRYDVERAAALEIDEVLRDALDDALLDTSTSDHDLLNKIIGRLRSAGHRTTLLSSRVRDPVADQIEVATSLAYHLFDDDDLVGPWILQLGISSAREVLAPLVRAPGLRPPKPGEPVSFPDLPTFTQMMAPGGGGYDAAKDWSREHTPHKGFRYGT